METRLDMPRIRTGGSWYCFTSTLTRILAGAVVPGEGKHFNYWRREREGRGGGGGGAVGAFIKVGLATPPQCIIEDETG